MNQKDYKAIAEIMKWCPNAVVTTGYKEGLEDGRKHFVMSLADYFEKEDCKGLDRDAFEKQQFLKDCVALKMCSHCEDCNKGDVEARRQGFKDRKDMIESLGVD